MQRYLISAILIIAAFAVLTRPCGSNPGFSPGVSERGNRIPDPPDPGVFLYVESDIGPEPLIQMKPDPKNRPGRYVGRQYPVLSMQSFRILIKLADEEDVAAIGLFRYDPYARAITATEANRVRSQTVSTSRGFDVLIPERQLRSKEVWLVTNPRKKIIYGYLLRP